MGKIAMLISYSNKTNPNGSNPIFENLHASLPSMKLFDIPNLYTKHYQTKFNRIVVFVQYAILAIKSLANTNKGDTILSMNFIVGVFVGLFVRLFRLNRNIIAVNIIFTPKGGLYDALRIRFYNFVFSENFYVTINTLELIVTYRKLGIKLIDKNVFVLNDSLSVEYKQKKYELSKKQIFCGGENGRDWVSMIKVANLMPNVEFVFVARKAYFEIKREMLSKNIKLYFDLSIDEFYELLEESSIVAMPLIHSSPAGLTVIIRAALLSKVIITTDTPSLKNYIVNDVSGYLVPIGDYKQIVEIISNVFYDDNLLAQVGSNAYSHIQKYSFENYILTLTNIIKKVSNEK